MFWSILLIGSTAFSAPSDALDPYADAECWTATDIGAAPANTNLQLHLAPVRGVPGGILFPAETARNTLWRLYCLKRWPEAAQIKLDEQAALYEFDLDRERALTDELRAMQTVAPTTPWGWYIGLTAGGLAVGLILGLVLGG